MTYSYLPYPKADLLHLRWGLEIYIFKFYFRFWFSGISLVGNNGSPLCSELALVPGCRSGPVGENLVILVSSSSNSPSSWVGQKWATYRGWSSDYKSWQRSEGESLVKERTLCREVIVKICLWPLSKDRAESEKKTGQKHCASCHVPILSHGLLFSYGKNNFLLKYSLSNMSIAKRRRSWPSWSHSLFFKRQYKLHEGRDFLVSYGKFPT